MVSSQFLIFLTLHFFVVCSVSFPYVEPIVNLVFILIRFFISWPKSTQNLTIQNQNWNCNFVLVYGIGWFFISFWPILVWLTKNKLLNQFILNCVCRCLVITLNQLSLMEQLIRWNNYFKTRKWHSQIVCNKSFMKQ